MTRDKTALQLLEMIERRDLTLAWIARRLGVSRQMVHRALANPEARLSDNLASRIRVAIETIPLSRTNP